MSVKHVFLIGPHINKLKNKINKKNGVSKTVTGKPQFFSR